MRNESGVTMIELAIVIGIIGIIASIAAPNLRSWFPNYRLRSATQDLYNNIQLAKLTSIKRNINCAISFLSDGSGYDIFIDTDRDFIRDGGEEQVKPTIQWANQYSNDVTASIADNTFDDTPGQPTFAFQPSGIPDVNAGLPNGTIVLRNSNNRNMSVVVSQAGHIRIQ